MSFRILQFPEDLALLRRRALPLPDSAFGTPVLREYAQQLGVAMLLHKGIGIAATQVEFDPCWRVVIVSMGGNAYSALCNPEITDAGGTIEYQEGCLSFSSVTERLLGPMRVVVRYRTTGGETREKECDVNASRVVFHECEHLDGKLMIDRMGELQRRMFLRKVGRQRREEAEEAGS